MIKFLLFAILAAVIISAGLILWFLFQTKKEIKNFMSEKTDELKGAVADLKQAVADEVVQIEAKLDKLTHANDGDNTEIDEVIADIRQTTANIKNIVADDAPAAGNGGDATVGTDTGETSGDATSAEPVL